ncbi:MULTISPECIES: beta-ketoacyl-ACP synthase III [unclassified Rhodococcus (in: high G+C Gram-positive bacteria)]|uniref:beta-ketoacyl-ACP synthase III n=1 Tax=unclassified Rhodococcus (in: high G+C Gram-positive bacteria) TaxID=192944 RepID=UPI000E0B6C61|nr:MULTISPECIES: beta-ketoacyl-ACP synthase III [unclassified Rhodococcus (in: high G+C Gram-positive bacteria)]QKT13266.1 ketoacyl-ACP synthase III [Rhodococcus sp. W8901]RDI18999.1 beta-ketoacyl ACP synthase [Rhodococcus sp. AG1013]
MGAQISNSTEVRQSAILGLGVYRPQRVVSNEEICELIDSTDEWIQSRSGIKNRRFANDEESVLAMAISSGRKALEAAGLTGEQIGAVVVATSTYPSQTPQCAAIVADVLGTGGAAAFDVTAGCAGFCYALSIASDMVRIGTAQYVLVIGVERMSDSTEPTDRSVRFIFGDGAGAVVVGPSDVAGIGPVVWGSDGSQSQAIRQEPDWLSFANDPSQRPWIKMEGTAVFRWAAFEMGKVATQALERAGVAMEDLGAFIPHQANGRINEVIARSIKLPESVPVSDDIADTGNTSAASIPLAMEEVIRTGKAKPGELALLVGFGAGLSYAGQVVTLPPLAQD